MKLYVYWLESGIIDETNDWEAYKKTCKALLSKHRYMIVGRQYFTDENGKFCLSRLTLLQCMHVLSKHPYMTIVSRKGQYKQCMSIIDGRLVKHCRHNFTKTTNIGKLNAVDPIYYMIDLRSKEDGSNRA